MTLEWECCADDDPNDPNARWWPIKNARLVQSSNLRFFRVREALPWRPATEEDRAAAAEVSATD